MRSLLCRAMVTKNFLRSAAACRELFFSGHLPEELLERYQGLLREHASDISVINVRLFPSALPAATRLLRLLMVLCLHCS